MDIERMGKIQRIFERAVALPPAERERFLSRASGKDEDLRREVESLLAADREAGAFLERPAIERQGPRPAAEFPRAAPARVGHYKLLRKIGEGGMSEVHLAVRADDEYQKRVALKIVRRDMDRDDLLRRFRTERQILAGLDHPNIAKLLDGGSTEDGLPYFVMDYIEGIPIDAYCDANRLSVRERLELFRKVCSAVQYAHQNLIVHRDLKASNILVTVDGVPKLLDFGIAKLLSPDQLAQQAEHTATWLRPMTPLYASPEQVQGKLVGTPSDVYSLGILLYKLLTGHLPYHVEERSPTELVRLILEEDPERPSTSIDRVETEPGRAGQAETSVTPESVSRARRAAPQQLRRQLAGDLDNILLMALRKEPQRRYGSVEQFSEDLRRYLAGLPVVARRDTFAYRTTKFVRRNRVAVAAAVGGVLLLTAFSITMAVQAARVAHERDQARRERDTAQQVVAFMEEIFEVADPLEAEGEDITAREILHRGAEKVARELRDQPEIQATLMNAIGNVYRNLGLYEAAEPLLASALETRRTLTGVEPSALAQTLSDLGLLLRLTGEYGKAEPLLREALDLHRSAFGDDDPVVSASVHRLGKLLQDKGDYEGAERLYREALELGRRTDVAALDLAQQQSDLAILLSEQGRYEEAERLFEETLELRRELLGAEHALVAEAQNNLGVFLGIQGEFARAEPLFRESLRVRRERLGGDHPSVAESLNNLGRLLRELEHFEEAEQVYREGLTIWRSRLGDDHPRLAKQTSNLASLLIDKGDYAAAEPLAREALRIRRTALGDEHPELGISLKQLGQILVSVGDPESAEPLLRESVAVFERTLADEHWRTAEARSLLGQSLAARGRFEEAEPLLLDAYAVLEKRRGAENRRTRGALERIVQLYLAWGKPDTADQYRLLARN